MSYYGGISGPGKLVTSVLTGDWSTDSMIDKLLRFASGNNSYTANTTNNVTVSSTDEAAQYVNQTTYNSIKDAWWGNNAASRNAHAIGNGYQEETWLIYLG